MGSCKAEHYKIMRKVTNSYMMSQGSRKTNKMWSGTSSATNLFISRCNAIGDATNNCKDQSGQEPVFPINDFFCPVPVMQSPRT